MASYGEDQGKFLRRFKLSKDAKVDEIKADMENRVSGKSGKRKKMRNSCLLSVNGDPPML